MADDTKTTLPFVPLADQPHNTALLGCAACGHLWQGVWPSRTPVTALVCPQCGVVGRAIIDPPRSADTQPAMADDTMKAGFEQCPECGNLAMNPLPTCPTCGEPLIAAATHADWQQVVLNGGPPCFHLLTEGQPKFCLAAQRWAGHADHGHHRFVPLDALIAAVRAENAQEKLAEALLALPRRLEPISGQTFSYIKLDDALALVGYPPYPPTS